MSDFETQRHWAEMNACEYCFNAPAHHDPVLGWICTPCEREITQGDDDAD